MVPPTRSFSLSGHGGSVGDSESRCSKVRRCRLGRAVGQGRHIWRMPGISHSSPHSFGTTRSLRGSLSVCALLRDGVGTGENCGIVGWIRIAWVLMRRDDLRAGRRRTIFNDSFAKRSLRTHSHALTALGFIESTMHAQDLWCHGSPRAEWTKFVVAFGPLSGPRTICCDCSARCASRSCTKCVRAVAAGRLARKPHACRSRC